VKRFIFRFEAVLKHRAITEELRTEEFARVQAELAACDGRIAACRREFDITVSGRPERIDVEDFPRREHYLDTLRARIEQETRIREGIAARLEDARRALVAAKQAREALERIRETDFDAYRREAARAEQNALDEVASQRFQRIAANSRSENPQSAIRNPQSAGDI
jgi:flagellar FliJ protein